MFSVVEMRGSSWRRERPNVRSAMGRMRIKGRARSARVNFDSGGVEGFDGVVGLAGGMVAGGSLVWRVSGFGIASFLLQNEVDL